MKLIAEHSRYLLMLIGAIAFAGPSLLEAEDQKFSQKQLDFFESKIRPLLASRCYDCHGEDEQEGKLRLDSVAAMLRGGTSGPAVVAGKPEESLLLIAVGYQNQDLQMPPDEQLSKGEIADLTAWIKQGIPHPKEADLGAVRLTDEYEWDKERQFWSFRPPQETPPPDVKNQNWVRDPIDRFILSKLEENDLAPAPEAGKRTLIRRATFDLIGLPPTPEEISDFLADDSPEAYEKLVERLLDSPHYGERWARHWLDVARYADSNGLDENVAHGNAWRYRDYVVQSIQQDKPIDQFFREQLAGDLLDSGDDEDLHRERLIATGFLSLGPKVLAEVDETKMEMDIIDEQIATVGQAMLGLTLACARCHSHKFDPIPTSDYYALAGIFRSTKSMENFTKVAKWHENEIATAEQRREKSEHETRIAAQKKQIEEYLLAANKQLEGDSEKIPPEKLEERYSPETKAELERLRNELKTLEAATPVLPTAMGVQEGQPQDVRLHVRGSHLTLGTVVPRHLPVLFAGFDQPAFPEDQSGRLRFADWLVSRENPLSARVFVNRVWRWHFGEGLVRTPDNFGHQGEPPTHPELLDWLTIRFVDSGWSLKELHRSIMLSSTYRMSSQFHSVAAQRDPENRLWWRSNVRRLEAEEIRDALLAVSGQLDRTIGGSLLTVDNRDYFFNHTSQDKANYDAPRRSIYLPVVRNHLYEVFQLFDYSDASISNGDRPSSTVVTQALFSLNGKLVREAALRMAENVLSRSDLTDAERFDAIYVAAYGRSIRDDEIERNLQFLEEFAQDASIESDKAHLQSWHLLCQAVLASNEFMYLK